MLEFCESLFIVRKREEPVGRHPSATMMLRSLASDNCLSETSDLDWGTSFAFSAICTAASIILYFSPKGCHKVVPSYFLSTGISYAVLGLRQILHEELSQAVREALEMTSNIFYGLGSILLLVLSMLMVKINPRSESKVKMVTFWFTTSSISGFMLVTIFVEAKMNSGVPLHASLSFGLLMILMSVYIFHMCLDRTKIWHYIAKALAVFIIAIEVLYSTIIASMECAKCSATCKNTASTDSTNAVVHDVVLFFGFTILAWGEDNSPSVTIPGFNQYTEGVVEEATDAADTSVSDWVTSEGSVDLEGSTYGDDHQRERVLLEDGEEEKEEEKCEARAAEEDIVAEKNSASRDNSDEESNEEEEKANPPPEVHDNKAEDDEEVLDV